jgi:hypothetical protein
MHPTLRLLRAVTALCLLAALPAGCGDHLPPGPVPTDYAESPLKPEVQGFAGALQTSNAVLELLQKGDVQGVYERYADPRLKQAASAEKFAQLMGATIQRFGPLQAFKPMQWGFAQEQADGLRLLYSTKIVAHERGWMTYRFRFEDDGKYEKVLDIIVLERKPGQR